MTMRRIIIALAAVAALAACGSATATPSTGTAQTAASTPTPIPPTPTPDLRAIAAQQYLAAINAYNVANDAFNAANRKLSPSAPWSAVVALMRPLNAAGTVFEKALFSIQFPPTMAADASAVVSATNTNLADEVSFITTPDQSTWNTLLAAATAGSSASNAIRHDLGLPPVSNTATP